MFSQSYPISDQCLTSIAAQPGNKEIYQRLKTQCQNNNIRVLSSIDQLKESLEPGESHCILDAIFGFSFKPPVRAPFDEVLSLLNASDLPIVSVDIPSGWDVEKGPVELETQVEGKGNVQGVKASVLVSLTAPKLGVRSFKGRHFLGGRFVPKCVVAIFPVIRPMPLLTSSP